jgi:hypothetical protein
MFSAVSAERLKIETEESFSAGESITIKVLIYDSEDNLIEDNVDIIIEDAEKRTTIEKTILSDQLITEDLGEGARSGLWSITAKYQGEETTAFFEVETKEEAKFEIDGDRLTITNIGNTRYTNEIDIAIGDHLGSKSLNLNMDESVSFRLIAPDGTYTVRVTDGTSTPLEKSDISLTGNVVGILDENIAASNNPLTGGIKPKDDEGTFKPKNYVYVFVLVIIGAAVLLAVERKYKKKH